MILYVFILNNHVNDCDNYLDLEKIAGLKTLIAFLVTEYNKIHLLVTTYHALYFSSGYFYCSFV